MAMKTSVRIEYKPGTALQANKRGQKTPVDPNEIVTIIIAPRDTTFVEALQNAGITIKRLEDILPPSIPEPDTPEPDPLDIDNILKDKP